jgi:hypothetical protein
MQGSNMGSADVYHITLIGESINLLDVIRCHIKVGGELLCSDYTTPAFYVLPNLRASSRSSEPVRRAQHKEYDTLRLLLRGFVNLTSFHRCASKSLLGSPSPNTAGPHHSLRMNAL